MILYSLIQTKMNFFTLLLLSLAGLVVSSEKDDFLFSLTSTEGAKVSDEYAGRGYDEFHVANCTYIIYGTPKNQAAGDRDMKTLSKIIVTQFNNAFSGIAAAVAEDYDELSRVKMVTAEIISQQVGQTDSKRRLGSFGNANDVIWGFNAGSFVLGFVSSFSWDDNGDHRRLKTNAQARRKFLTEVANDLLESDSMYYASALEAVDCHNFFCHGDEGGDGVGQGCKEIGK